MTAPVVWWQVLKDSRHREAVAARDLSDWLVWLEVSNKAARTLDTYERYGAALLRAYPHKRFDEFTDGDLLHVIRLSPARSRHIVKAAWNNWFRWGYKQRRIPGNPVDLLPEIKYRPDRQYDLFTDTEADQLCALPSPDGALCTLLFWAGLRRSEARFLTGRRINFDSLEIAVIEGAKGGKTRPVPMVGRVSQVLAELVMLEGIQPEHHLWYSRPGGGRIRREQPVSNATFDVWWNRVLAAAAVRHRRPHLARHTFATRMRREGLASEELQAILGHESIRTTLDTYVHANVGRIGDHMRELVG